jgi:branched-subunit amino acid ABC-type transport system permease component
MDSIAYYLHTLLNGVLAGCIYALFAMGLTLIYGVLNFVNFAHGELIMWGAYFLFLFMGEPFGLPLYAALLPALALTGCLGLAMDYSVFRPIRRANRLTLLIPAMGLSVFLRNAAQFFWGAEVRTYGLEVSAGTRFFGLYPQLPQMAIIAVTVLCVARSTCSSSSRASASRCGALSDNLDLARISGIDTKRTILAAWVISASWRPWGASCSRSTRTSPRRGVSST